MNLSHFHQQRSHISLVWLLRLRWFSVLGQTFTILTAKFFFDPTLSLPSLLFLVTLSALSNGLAHRVSQSLSVEALLRGILIFDVLQLTLLLHLSGGPFNPFSSFYLVFIVLSLIVLPGLESWFLTFFALICFASLFFFYKIPNSPTSHAHHDVNTHLQGMWVALGVTSIIIVYFVRHILRSLRGLEAELEKGREALRRREKIHSLGTLAAGAAHELSTPLSTVAIIAKELEYKFRESDPRVVKDIHILREEIDRCKDILLSMSAYSGHQPGESSQEVTIQDLLTLVTKDYSGNILLVIPESITSLHLKAPVQAVKMCLLNIVKNAVEASAGKLVKVSASVEGSNIIFKVSDSGLGMSKGVLEKLGEPFVTTKAPGQGMGLGVFISRSIVEQLGGHIDFQSELDHGTTVTIDLPLNSHDD